MPDSGTRTVRSFCRVCQSVCGILVDVHIDGDSDRVLQVHGDRDHPVSAGYTCAKGRALPQLHHHPLLPNGNRDHSLNENNHLDAVSNRQYL